MSSLALETRGLLKNFGALRVVDGVSLQLPIGARHALIGPNGAGKTTVVALLSGLLRPDAGEVRLLDRDVTRSTPHARVAAGLARTFQINNLFTGLTVLENLALAIGEKRGVSRKAFRPSWRRSDIRAEAAFTATSLGLADDLDKRVGEISYGRQRLVELGLALSVKPSVLLLDEPVAGVSRQDAVRLMGVLDALPRDLAVLVIEHDMRVVREIATEVTVLVGGRVLISSATSDVLSSNVVRDVYLGRSTLGHETDRACP